MKDKLWSIKKLNELEDYELMAEIYSVFQSELKAIPDKLLKINISGVAMPRTEMGKISIQDLRLALEELE